MSNNNIKISINNELTKFKNLNSEDDKNNDFLFIASAAITYELFKKIISQNPSQIFNISSLTSSYLKTYFDKIKSSEGKFTNYFKIKQYIEENKITSFFSADDEQLSEIYKFYQDKTEVLPFSRNSFSLEFFNVGKYENISLADISRLKEIHRSIFVPIYTFFNQMRGVKEEDIIIIDAKKDSLDIGKKIEFKINSINPATIVTKIKSGFVGIEKREYFSVVPTKDSVIITLKK